MVIYHVFISPHPCWLLMNPFGSGTCLVAGTDFQSLTNCPICNPFVLKTIQQYPGCGYHPPPSFKLSDVHRPKHPLFLVECAVTRFHALSPLECAVPKMQSWKSFRMRSYEKRRGEGA